MLFYFLFYDANCLVDMGCQEGNFIEVYMFILSQSDYVCGA